MEMSTGNASGSRGCGPDLVEVAPAQLAALGTDEDEAVPTAFGVMPVDFHASKRLSYTLPDMPQTVIHKVCADAKGTITSRRLLKESSVPALDKETTAYLATVKKVAPTFVTMVPGIRLPESSLDDQARVMGPGDAIRAGSDVVILARAVHNAPDPIKAAQQVYEEVEGALAG